MATAVSFTIIELEHKPATAYSNEFYNLKGWTAEGEPHRIGSITFQAAGIRSFTNEVGFKQARSMIGKVHRSLDQVQVEVLREMEDPYGRDRLDDMVRRLTEIWQNQEAFGDLPRFSRATTEIY